MVKVELYVSNYDEVFEFLFLKYYSVSVDSEVRVVKE